MVDVCFLFVKNSSSFIYLFLIFFGYNILLEAPLMNMHNIHFCGEIRTIQLTLVISTLLISNTRLTRSENLIPVLTWKSNSR